MGCYAVTRVVQVDDSRVKRRAAVGQLSRPVLLQWQLASQLLQPLRHVAHTKHHGLIRAAPAAAAAAAVVVSVCAGIVCCAASEVRAGCCAEPACGVNMLQQQLLLLLVEKAGEAGQAFDGRVGS